MLNGANYDQYDLLRQHATDNTLPQSYINYMMFDEQMQLLPAQSGAIQVKSASADAWALTGTDGSININNNGYLLVFLGNNQVRDVYWDDLHVLHKKGRLLEENHYYPHGLTIRSGISSPLPTRRGYQGKELQDEVGMELYDFHARQYDPQVGRFWGVDPMNQFPSGYTGMGNDPANLIDPTGMAAFGSGGGMSYDPFAIMPVFQGATFEGLRNPFDNMTFAPQEEKKPKASKGSGSQEATKPPVDQQGQGSGGAEKNNVTTEAKNQNSTSNAQATPEVNSKNSIQNPPWKIEVTGSTSDKLDDGKVRQQGKGTMEIVDSKGEIVGSYDVLSGPGGNGVLPNGDYRASNLTSNSKFDDETHLKYQITLDPIGPLAAGFTRTALLIHPVHFYQNGTGPGGIPYFVTGVTIGCIGLMGHPMAGPFLQTIKPYLQTYKTINVNVNFDGNANVKTQLGNAPTYKK